MSNIPFGLQLYSIRDYMEKDAPGTLEQVKAMGYNYVELAGLYDLSPAEFKVLLDQTGLISVAGHFQYGEVVGRVPDVIEILDALEMKHAVIPWIGPDQCPDEAAWVEMGGVLEKAGRELRAAGFTLSYHNHSHEFHRVNGRCFLDVLFDCVAPEHLSTEIDTYWVKFGGADPVEVLKRYAGRCPLVHIKDMEPDEPHGFAEVGRGIMDWDLILPTARDAGAKCFIVEQDECLGDSLEAVRVSAEFMKQVTY